MFLGCKHFILFILLLAGTLRLTAQNYLEFVENKGQWEGQVKFQGQLGQSGSFYLEKNGFKVLLHNPEDMQRIIESHHNISGVHRPTKSTILKPGNSTSLARLSNAVCGRFRKCTNHSR